MEKIIEKIIHNAKWNLAQRAANIRLATRAEELHHWKDASMYNNFADGYQKAFMEDVSIYGEIKELDWLDACKELHRLADKF